MYLGSTRNDAGAVTHNYRCDTCTEGFTVTGIGQVVNRPCRLPGCPSYDAQFDIDLALSRGDVELKAPDGRVIRMRKRPLDEKRVEFLQRTGNRNHPVVVVRRKAGEAVAPNESVEINLIAATCKTCGAAREFKLNTPFQSPEEITTWLCTKLAPCECGSSKADIAMRLDKVEPTAN